MTTDVLVVLVVGIPCIARVLEVCPEWLKCVVVHKTSRRHVLEAAGN